jgi:hypothetical protein
MEYKMPDRFSYPYIRAWEKYSGSRRYYINERIERAVETNAPENAIYEVFDKNGPTGTWQTVDDIASPQAKHIVEQYAREYK